MKERKRRHDDAHYPMGGKGRRARRPKNRGPYHPPVVTDNTFNKKIIGWDREKDLPIYE